MRTWVMNANTPEGDVVGVPVVAKDDYDALAARLAEAEKLIRDVKVFLTYADQDDPWREACDEWLSQGATAPLCDCHEGFCYRGEESGPVVTCRKRAASSATENQ